jgi:uncharacterized membrane protein YcaP (DUF421 family)
MTQPFYSMLDQVLGLNIEPQDLSTNQMSARAIIVFTATLLMLRLAHKRFFARRNTLDVVLAIVIASLLARAINGGAAFFPTIAVGFGFIFLHRALAWASARFAWIGLLMKGNTAVLIEDGRINTETLRKHSLSLDDLYEDLRLKGIDHPQKVRLAILERNGEVSVVKE